MGGGAILCEHGNDTRCDRNRSSRPGSSLARENGSASRPSNCILRRMPAKAGRLRRRRGWTIRAAALFAAERDGELIGYIVGWLQPMPGLVPEQIGLITEIALDAHGYHGGVGRALVGRAARRGSQRRASSRQPSGRRITMRWRRRSGGRSARRSGWTFCGSSDRTSGAARRHGRGGATVGSAGRAIIASSTRSCRLPRRRARAAMPAA